MNTNRKTSKRVVRVVVASAFRRPSQLLKSPTTLTRRALGAHSGGDGGAIRRRNPLPAVRPPQLGQRMHARRGDLNGSPLPAMAMDPIAGDLELLYDKLDGRDLSAGSPQARRVFS